MWRTIVLMLLIAVSTNAWAQCITPGAHTLYRDSPAFKDERIHVATFDGAAGEDYNRENCAIAAGLFVNRPGVAVRYWCERGRTKG